MATMNVKDAAGATVDVQLPLAPGRVAAASASPVTIATEDLAALTAIKTSVDASAAALLTDTQLRANPLTVTTGGLTNTELRASAIAVGGSVASGAADAGNGNKISAVFYSANPTVTSGQRVDLQSNSRGQLQIAIMDAAGALQAAVTNSGSISTSSYGLVTRGLNHAFDGTNWVRPFGDLNGQGVQGSVASGVTDAGFPVKFGGVYNATMPTVTTGQRVDAQFSARGEQLVQLSSGGSAISTSAGGTNQDGIAVQSSANYLNVRSVGYLFNGASYDRPRGDANGAVTQPALSSTFWNYAAPAAGIANTATAVDVKAAGAAGVRNYVSSIQIDFAALGAATTLVIRDGASNVLWRMAIPAGLPGMREVTFAVPLKGTAATVLQILAETAVTGAINVNLQGYTGV
jgi:hypothetical protein